MVHADQIKRLDFNKMQQTQADNFDNLFDTFERYKDTINIKSRGQEEEDYESNFLTTARFTIAPSKAPSMTRPVIST